MIDLQYVVGSMSNLEQLSFKIISTDDEEWDGNEEYGSQDEDVEFVGSELEDEESDEEESEVEESDEESEDVEFEVESQEEESDEADSDEYFSNLEDNLSWKPLAAMGMEDAVALEPFPSILSMKALKKLTLAGPWGDEIQDQGVRSMGIVQMPPLDLELKNVKISKEYETKLRNRHVRFERQYLKSPDW